MLEVLPVPKKYPSEGCHGTMASTRLDDNIHLRDRVFGVPNPLFYGVRICAGLVILSG